MQIAPHPFLQFARLGHILPHCHTGTLFFFSFLFANCHMTSPFLQTSPEWEMKWQPAVLIRICLDEVPSLNFGRLMGRWSWNTCPGGSKDMSGMP